MALTRARPVFGSEEGRTSLQRVLDGALLMPRDPAKLIADAARMRADMAAHKPANGPFDIKLGDGGLVDLEFAVHTLQLRYRVGLVPQLGRALDLLIAEGLLPASIADAHRLLTRMLVTLRLVSPTSAEPPPASRPLVARACGVADWDSLLAAHDAARHRVFQTWRDVAAHHGD
jgi:glutamate-ammonia-ligase adenylyltransferase